MFLAEQLNHTNYELVYMDFSKTSLLIGQRRALARSIHSIVWIHSWIEESRYLGLGIFDNIESGGVLHHLKSPAIGLNVLKDVSHAHGGMDLMVYAQFGRAAVYMLQYLMQLINYHTEPIVQQLKHCSSILSNLPKHHWFIVNTLVSDHLSGNSGR